jgi:hypothetical protein
MNLSSQTQLGIKRGPATIEIKKLILSPLLRWVWTNLSSQTQLEYKRIAGPFGVKRRGD